MSILACHCSEGEVTAVAEKAQPLIFVPTTNALCDKNILGGTKKGLETKVQGMTRKRSLRTGALEARRSEENILVQQHPAEIDIFCLNDGDIEDAVEDATKRYL